jgi:hypothetical protein
MVLTPKIELNTEKPLDFFKIPRIFPQFTLLAIRLSIVNQSSIDVSKTSGQQLSSLMTQVESFGRKNIPFVQFLTKEGWISYWLETDFEAKKGTLVNAENCRDNWMYHNTCGDETRSIGDFCHWANVRFGHWGDFPFIDIQGIKYHIDSRELWDLEPDITNQDVANVIKEFADSYLKASSAKFVV